LCNNILSKKSFGRRQGHLDPLVDAASNIAGTDNYDRQLLTSITQLQPVKTTFCIPAFFSGKLYKETPLLLASMRMNPDVSWLLVHIAQTSDVSDLSDLATLLSPGLTPNPPWPPNLQVVHTSPDEVQVFVEGALSIKFPQPLRSMPHGAKLNDWKPATGRMFSSLISQCQFWGYADLDSVYGSFNETIPLHIRERNDILTWKKSLSGPATFFRNM
jgi:hypothetical protein